MVKEITEKEPIFVNGTLTSIETLKEEIIKDEIERMLSIVSRCIAHNIYNVSEGIALLNEIK